MNVVAVAAGKEQRVMRPPSVLVPLIRDDLKQARVAVEKAGTPFYQSAGEKLIEAKSQLERGTFMSWVKDNCRISQRTANQYMELARKMANGNAIPGDDEEELSLRAAVRKHTANKNYGKAASWQADIKEHAKRARAEAARLAVEEHLSRSGERDAEKQLALRLIDIGFKVLVKELHPDRGGTKDAMSRLSRVRERLKSHA
jgi:hypothetical protein